MVREDSDAARQFYVVREVAEEADGQRSVFHHVDALAVVPVAPDAIDFILWLESKTLPLCVGCDTSSDLARLGHAARSPRGCRAHVEHEPLYRLVAVPNRVMLQVRVVEWAEYCRPGRGGDGGG